MSTDGNTKAVADRPCRPAMLLGAYIATLLMWRITSFAAVLALWAAIAILAGASLPGPIETVQAIPQLAGHSGQPTIWHHALASACRAYTGLALAFLTFVPLGVLLGAGQLVYQSSMGLVEFARSIPAFMLILVLVSLGLSGESARLLCVWAAVGVLILDNTATAMRNIPSESLDVLRAVKAPAWKVFQIGIWVPLFLNAILPALRIGVGISLIVALVVESLLVPNTGLGMLLNNNLGRVDLAGGLALLLVTGVVGWVGNVIVLITSDVSWWFFYGRPLSSSLE